MTPDEGMRFFERELGAELVWVVGDAASMDEVLKEAREGIYIQCRRDGRFYVGESRDVRRRQKEHLARGADVVALALIAMPGAVKSALREKETAVIERAVGVGISLTNLDKLVLVKEKRTQAHRAAPASSDLTPAMIDAFLADFWSPDALFARKAREWTEADAASREALETFRQSPLSWQAIFLVNAFVRAVVPDPGRLWKKRWRTEFVPHARENVPWLTVRLGETSALVLERWQTDEGETLAVGLRMATAPLEAAWGSLQAAHQHWGGYRWERRATDDGLKVLKGAAGAVPHFRLAAAAASGRFWSKTGDRVTAFVTGCMAQDLMASEETLLAMQLAAVEDLMVPLPAKCEGVTLWPW